MKNINDIIYCSPNGEDLKLDVYIPDSKHFDTLIYFHGGGLEEGDKGGDLSAVFFALAEKGIAVVSANYRMYPNAKYPQFIEDAAQVVAWTKNNMVEYGVTEKVYISGSSAGAYLVLMLCFDKKYLGKHGIDSDDFAGYIFDAGQQTTHFNVLRERGIDSRRIIVDEAAPLYHITSNPNYTKMMFVVADNDIQNRLEETNLMYTALKTFGNDPSKFDLTIVKGANHCDYHLRVDQKGEFFFVNLLLEAMGKKRT